MTDYVPQYLVEPEVDPVRCYGRVSYNPGDDSFELRAEPAVVEFAKRVFPGSLGVNVKVLRFPANRRTAGDLNWLMLRFPLRVECQELFALARREAIEHARRRDGAAMVEPVRRPVGFCGSLFEYQALGVGFLMANERCLLADDMGLGKTVQALAAMAAVGAWPVLVVVPASVQRQWARMAERFLDLKPGGDLVGGGARVHVMKGLRRYALPEADVYICHYGLLRGWRRLLAEEGFRVVVFDEVQELRRTGTEKYSAASVAADGAEYVWGLSGTPIYNLGGEIWAVMNVVDRLCLGDYGAFTREWCTGYNAQTVANPAVLGDYLRREGLMLRRRKQDVLSELPAKRRVVVEVDHDAGVYTDLVREAMRLARGFDEIQDRLERGRAARQVSEEARRATGEAKAPFVAAFVSSLVEAGEKVVVFAYHHAVHDILLDRLSRHGALRVTGKESPKEKEAAVAAFRAADGPSVIVLSLRTAAGLDGLQDRGTCVVFGELDWSPAIHAQCEDRLHRMGFEGESLLCYYLVAETGSDEVMREALGLKVGQFAGLMGDGVASAEDEALAGRAAEGHLVGIIARLKGEGCPEHAT